MGTRLVLSTRSQTSQNVLKIRLRLNGLGQIGFAFDAETADEVH